MRNKILTLLLALSFFQNTLFAQWVEIPGPSSTSFPAIALSNGVLLAGGPQDFRRSFDGNLWQSEPFDDGIFFYQTEVISENNQVFYFRTDDFSQSSLYRSADDGNTWSMLDLGEPFVQGTAFSSNRLFKFNGLLSKSDNDGTSWETSFQTAPNEDVHDVAKYQSQLLMATTKGIYASADNGDAWSFISDDVVGVPDTFLSLSKLFPFEMVVFFRDIAGDLYRSLNGGVDWALLSQPAYADDMAMENGIVYLATSYGAVLVSTDLGDTWTSLHSPWQGKSIIVSGDTIYLGTVNGFYRSYDAGVTWLSGCANFGYDDPYYGSLYGLTFIGGKAYSTSRGHLFHTENGGESWTFDFFLGGPEFVQTDDAWIAYTSETALLTFDEGESWQLMPLPEPGDQYFTRMAFGNGWLFFAKYDGNIWRTDDYGQNWEYLGLVSAEPNMEDLAFAQGKLFYVNFYGIYSSDDNGVTWAVEEGGLPPNISDFNKKLFTDGEQVFFNNYQTTNNWRFNFGTAEWEPRITGNLLAFGSNYTVFHSSNGSLRLSTDTGITWQDVGPSNASLVVGSLAIEQNTLYVSGFSAQFPGKACLWALDLAAIGSGDAIGGKVFFDDNGDGIPDAGEPGLPYTPLTTAPFETAASTDADGSYGFLLWQTDDTLRAHMPSPYFSSQPAYHILAPPTLEYNFAVVAQPNAVDLCLSAVNHSVFRPGFSTNLTIDISNPGTVGQGGTVTVELPGIFLYENANPVPDNISGNTLTWNLAPVASLGNASIFLHLKTDVSAVAGQAYSIPFTVVAFEPDLNPANNGFQLEGEVVASFDPNDKQCTPASMTPQSAADRQPLTYTIRFQNTGNYPASFVRIADTLSTSLDLSTLQVLGSSHPMTYRLYGMGVLEFFFDNINLPDSISDEPGSHGFVQFSIRPKAGLELGDVVENTAFIYFDFNEPVITNTVQTKVEPTSKVSSGEKIGKVNIYPNPTSSSLRLGFDNTSTAELNLLLFDLWGRQLDRQIILRGSDFFDLDVEGLPCAIYFLRLTDGPGRTWNGKFVKQ